MKKGNTVFGPDECWCTNGLWRVVLLQYCAAEWCGVSPAWFVFVHSLRRLLNKDWLGLGKAGHTQGGLVGGRGVEKIKGYMESPWPRPEACTLAQTTVNSVTMFWMWGSLCRAKKERCSGKTLHNVKPCTELVKADIETTWHFSNLSLTSSHSSRGMLQIVDSHLFSSRLRLIKQRSNSNMTDGYKVTQMLHNKSPTFIYLRTCILFLQIFIL